MDLYTVGHGTRTQAEFAALLRGHGITCLADIRRHPGSRRCPQFNAAAMADWLPAAGIAYAPLPALGGRRGAQPGIPPDLNGGWDNSSFHHYADYGMTGEYAAGIEALCDLARTGRVAYLCAETVPWRCHRLLVSNSLTVRGWTVLHLLDERQVRPHRLGQWGAPCQVQDGMLVYPQQKGETP